MVKEIIAYQCEKSGCTYYSFSKEETKEHEKKRITGSSGLVGLILEFCPDEHYVVIRESGSLTHNHVKLYTWDSYKKNNLQKEEENRTSEYIFQYHGSEKEEVIDKFFGERSRTKELGKKEFKTVTEKLIEMYPNLYDSPFKFRRTYNHK